MVHADIQFITAQILGKMDKAGITVFENIIHQFLDNTEDDQFLFGMHAVAVIMKAATGIHATRTTDLLKEIVHRAFQPEILKRGRHQAMRDITNQLNGIVDNLFGIINTLELGSLIEVHQVFVEV